MSVSAKRRPAPHPVETPAPLAPTPTVPDAEGATAAQPLAYRGDVYGITILFGGAIILVLLHFLDVLYWWMQR